MNFIEILVFIEQAIILYVKGIYYYMEFGKDTIASPPPKKTFGGYAILASHMVTIHA